MAPLSLKFSPYQGTVTPLVSAQVSVRRARYKAMGSHNYCSIATCKNTSRSGSQVQAGLKFFRFPRNTTQRVCSIHFKPEDYEDQLQAKLLGLPPKKLKKDAIPSLFLQEDKCSSISNKIVTKPLRKRNNEVVECDKQPKRTKLQTKQNAKTLSHKSKKKDVKPKVKPAVELHTEVDLDSVKVEISEESDSLSLSSSSLSDSEDFLKQYSICCSVCDTTTLSGFRYFCVSCMGRALCADCVSGGAHETCYVLRAPPRSSQTEISSVLHAIRKELAIDRVSEELDEPPVEIKPEVKEESNEDSLDPLSETTPAPSTGILPTNLHDNQKALISSDGSSYRDETTECSSSKPEKAPKKKSNAMDAVETTDTQNFILPIEHEPFLQLLNNQEQIMKKIAVLQSSVDLLTGQRINQYTAQKTTSLPIKPINTASELETLENKLKSEEFYNNLITELTFICGSSGKCKGSDSCYKLVDYFFTRDFFLSCNWTGSTRDTNSDKKIPLKYYEKVRSCFFAIVRKSDMNYTEKECDKFFKIVIKNSKQRLNNKITSVTRTSKSRNKNSENQEVPRNLQNSAEVQINNEDDNPAAPDYPPTPHFEVRNELGPNNLEVDQE